MVWRLCGGAGSSLGMTDVASNMEFTEYNADDLNRPGVFGGGVRATANGISRSCERGRQEARLGKGQHRGIFCVSCLNGRLMLRG